MGLVIAVVVICLVILFREEIRSGLGHMGRSLLIGVPLLTILWWLGVPLDWRVIVGVAAVATVVERAWPHVGRLQAASRKPSDGLTVDELPSLSPEARLRRRFERGLITEEEFVRRWTELHGQPPLRIPSREANAEEGTVTGTWRERGGNPDEIADYDG